MPTIRLSWLGPPLIEVDGHAVRLEMRKTLALLAYLSLSPQSTSRETMATMFWPEYDQQHALSNLRRNLSSLAGSLPPGCLYADRERIELQMGDEVQVDVKEFHRLLLHANAHSHLTNQTCDECIKTLESAVKLYRGDILEGFNLKDCPGFDEWQLFQREGLRSKYAGALEKLASIYREQCEWEKAISTARSWVALDRLNENAQRLLIGLYYQSGQRSLALRQYETLVDLLQNELGQAPEAGTLSLYQSLLPVEAPGGAEKVPARPHPASRSTEPLIKTKLFIPPLRMDRVTRPYLFELLDAGAQRSMTLISAPAGFGKTTLLASWAAHTSLPIAWFSIDEGDNDPVRFVAYLIAALDSVLSTELSGQFQTFTQLLQPSIQPTLVQLINHLAGESEPFVLILDDYQFIHSEDVHKAVTFLLEKIPACMHLIIATRSDPPMSLALLRARDQLVEIRMNDLRFRGQESAGFFKQVMALQLSNEDLSALETRTEGWIAGLQMAALAIRTVASQMTSDTSAIDRDQAISQFIHAFSGSHRYILDYLGEEVLNQRPEEVRRFLLLTSILDRFSAPLCDAVTQAEGSQKILETLEKENLFVVPLDSERHWYRYHHLFGELLRYRLEEKLDKRSDRERQILPTLEELHLRAALWCEEQNLPDEAILHTLSAKKFELAAVYIEKHAHDILFRYGELYTLAKWLAAIPADIFQDRPRLSILKAWVMIFQYQFESPAETLNTTLQTIQRQQSAESASLLGEIALIQGIYAELVNRDVQAMREQARLAWEKLPEQDAMLRGLAAWLLGASYYYDGDNRNAIKHYQNAIRLCRKAGNIYSTVLSIADMCSALREEGRYREAYRLLIKTQQEIVSNKWQHPMLGLLYINSSLILLQWNEVDQAE
ncbi:MAG TPA: BTAD domain-containing putative transcriptional regulator, partial [Anaerolineales bacterium]|nr:BTAD domain-containing putative transcriptional regulator [Anaerolineales bacterium]